MILTIDAKNLRDAEYQIIRLFEAKNKFIPKENKPANISRDRYHQLTLALMERYSIEMHNAFQKTKNELKKAKELGYGQITNALMKALRRIRLLRGIYIKASYLIGRERGIAALKKHGLIKEADSGDWTISYDAKKVTDDQGREYNVDVPVLNMDINTPDEIDLQRIDDMIAGTEYSVGSARYLSRQKGPFLDAQFQKLNDRMTQNLDQDDMKDRDPNEAWPPDSVIDEEIDGMDTKAQFWSNELWATEEKAAINEWRDWQNENKGEAVYSWVGPDDDSTCDYCSDAMDGSPYTDIDDVPEPGEGECQCSCRHAVVLVSGEESA